MDEQAWIAAMRANPHCLRTMGGFADWLQERGDPRWEPLMMLYNDGKVGGHAGYTYVLGCLACVGMSWLKDAVDKKCSPRHPTYWDCVDNRLALIRCWVDADDEQRALYLADYLKTKEQ